MQHEGDVALLGEAALGGGAPASPEKDRVKLPAPCSGVGFSRATPMPSFSATATAGDSLPSATTSSLARRSVR